MLTSNMRRTVCTLALLLVLTPSVPSATQPVTTVYATGASTAVVKPWLADGLVPGTTSYLSKMPAGPSAVTDVPLQRIRSFNIQGGYVAAGVGMRNRGFGTISISGIPSGSQVKSAYLFWAVLANAIDPTMAQGNINGQSITGVLIGAGGDPCWGNNNNFAYQTEVTRFVSGNGNYSLSGFASGITNATDPWTATVRPMMEGASLVVVYENTSSPQTQVMIYDGSSETSSALIGLTIDGFTASSSVVQAVTTFIGADGQDAPEPGSTFNGNPLPSVGWDGNDPQAGPNFSHNNLWDTMTVDVTPFVSPGSTSASATVQGSPDCLVWVAQVFSVSTFAPPPVSGKPVVVLVHGWKGAPFGNNIQVHCSDGITQIDSVGNSPYFGDLPKWLRQDNFEVWVAHLDSGPDSTPAFRHNAQCLRDQISQVRDRAPDKKVILIAHSMGGLVSRAYLEDRDGLYQNDVKMLFTLGSPHLGVPVESLKNLNDRFLHLPNFDCNYQIAFCDLRVDSMKNTFNPAHPNRGPGVDYYLVSGDIGLFAGTVQGRLLWAALYVSSRLKGFSGANDAAVPQTSGLGLSSVHQSLATSEAHVKAFADYDYFHAPPGDLQSLAYSECIQPVLLGNRDGCRSLATQSPQVVTPPIFTALTPPVDGDISSGQLVTSTVGSDGAGSALFGASWVTGTLAFTLTSPTGQTIDPAFAAAHPGQLSYLESGPSETLLGASYVITSPVAGVWTMNLQAGNVSGGYTSYSMMVALASPITLTTQTDRSWYAAGQSATINITLGGGVIASNVQAQIQRPDLVTETVSLSSQGGGLYSASYMVPNVPGDVTLQALADGNDGAGHPFSRQATTAFQIASSAAALSNTYADRAEINDANGRFKDLAVDIGVIGNVIGNFSLAADLVRLADNEVVARSATSVLVVTGDQTVTLHFDGETIRASGIDGPYNVNPVLLIDNRGAALPVQEASNAWTTAAYDHNLFGNPTLFLPVIHK